MSPSAKFVPESKRKSRRHQPYGCMMLELDQKHKNVYQEAVRTEQECQSLYKSKTELQDAIEEYRRSELALANARDQYSKSVARLEAEVNDSIAYCDSDPKDKGVPDLIRQNDLNCIKLYDGQEKLEAATRELKFVEHLIIPKENNENESPNTSQVSPTIQLANIDESNVIKKNGSINLESWMNNKCCVCVKEPANTVLFGCQQVCVCWTCAEEIHRKKGTCPICHNPVEKIMKVFYV